ncbi:MAG: hypothetical protein ABR915_06440 [Thermoguttaceae bacterium]|jgi:hypothetical protein
MKSSKSFDCVEMKNAIQARLRKEHEGLSDEEVERRRRAWLEKSDDRLARWWRSIQAIGQAPHA